MELNWYEIVILGLFAMALVAYVVVQILRYRKDINAEQAEDAEGWIAKWVSIGVYAAEQIFGAKTGDKKLDYVTKLLSTLGIVVDESVRAMIEAAVYNLPPTTNQTEEK